MKSRPGPWYSNERVREQRMRAERIRDVRDFSGKGRYKEIGRGPYPWRLQPYPSAVTPIEAESHPPEGQLSLTGLEDQGWVRAPSGSHVDSFRYVHGLGPNDRDELQVIFKGDGPQVFYRYYGENGRQLRLRTIFDMLCSAAHPGQIIHSHLILEEWPYE